MDKYSGNDDETEKKNDISCSRFNCEIDDPVDKGIIIIETVHSFYPPVADFLSPFQGLKMFVRFVTQGVALD